MNSTEVVVEIVWETDEAFKVETGSGEDWIPKSQVYNLYEVEPVAIGDTVTFEIPEWLALDLGLI